MYIFEFVLFGFNVDCFRGRKALQHHIWARFNLCLVLKPVLTYVATEKLIERFKQSAWDEKGERSLMWMARLIFLLRQYTTPHKETKTSLVSEDIFSVWSFW